MMDRVCIITDLEKKHIAHEISFEIEKRGADIQLIEIEKDIGLRPVRGLPMRITDRLSQFKPTASYYIASSRIEENHLFLKPLIEFLTKKIRSRFAHMINITDEIMQQGMSVDYEKVRELTLKVRSAVEQAQTIRFTSRGSDITAVLSLDYRWYAETGKLTNQGEWSNLPSGKVFTCPKSVSGTLAGYLIGEPFTSKYGILENPIVIELKDSMIQSIQCKDDNIRGEFETYVNEFTNGNRVGECAIGTLIGLDTFVGNLLQDEKLPGFHIGFGDPQVDKTGASWSCQTHIDVLPFDCSIQIGDTKIFEKNSFFV